MFIKTKTVRRMFIVAGLSALAACASAFSGDPQVQIDRAIDSPTLTVRYSGVTASLIELRVNGASLGTRTVSSSKESGETNFTLNLSDLKEGDNDVMVCVYDRTGKLVKTEHTNIQTAPVEQGPVSLTGAKMGQTVRETLKLDAGFNIAIKDPYVSFLVDGNLKKMMNTPPYEYLWNTQLEANGWHELEAWAIDDSSTTHKSGKLRLFVDNSHGDTDRRGVSSGLQTSDNPDDVAISSAASGTKHVKAGPAIASSSARAAVPGLPARPVVHALPAVSAATTVSAHAPNGTKPVRPAPALIVGPYLLTPKVSKSALVASNHKLSHPDMVVDIRPSVQTPGRIINSTVNAMALMNITKGSRIPNIGAFEIALNGDFVDFHGVMPRVDDGVPMTPIRFLLEQAGGKVNWENYSKTVTAKTDSHDISLKIGDLNAMVNNMTISLERAPYIDRGRTIVPLSFIKSTLDVNVQYDKNTGHVLVTSAK